MINLIRRMLAYDDPLASIIDEKKVNPDSVDLGNYRDIYDFFAQTGDVYFDDLVRRAGVDVLPTDSKYHSHLALLVYLVSKRS